MRKLSIALGVFCLLGLTACGGGATESPSRTAESPGGTQVSAEDSEGSFNHYEPGGGDRSPAGSSKVPAIESVQLVQYRTSNDYEPLKTIEDGGLLVLANMPDVVNIEAVSTDPAKTGSVKFVLEGPAKLARVENDPIYTLADAFVNFDISENGLPEGSYILWVTPYAGANATGEPGETLRLHFSVRATEPKVPALTGVRLVEYFGTNDYKAVQPVTDGGQLVLANLPAVVNFEVLSADAARTGSVDLVLEGPIGVQRWENDPIYTVIDAYKNLNLSSGDLPTGDYTLRATPYTGPNRTGEQGETLVTRFSVSESAVNVPAITGAQVLARQDNQWVAVQSLADGGTLVLEGLPNLINVEAVSADVAKTGSVDFSLEGPVSLNRFENDPIYTLADEHHNLDLSANQLPEGNYTLRITPYAGSGLSGEAGQTFSVDFRVAATKSDDDTPPAPEPEPEPEKPAPPVSKVPAITGVQLLDLGSDNRYAVVRTVRDGDRIDMGKLPYTVNFEALSADADKTGSVNFALDGPVRLNRTENDAIYTLADEAVNFDIREQGLPTGDYVLRITPYAGPNASGEAGTTTTVRFSVTGKPATPPSEAVDDSYYGSQNQALVVNAASGVMANDRLETESARVSVNAQPKHGTVLLQDSGSFSYEPDHGFTGVDSFSYTLRDANDNESSAQVSLIIQTSSANAGFTPIVASSDTRTIYVSSSEGMDSNNGFSTSAPVKTLSKALSMMRSGYPDHVLLKRGDVWVDEELRGIKSGRSADEPAVVAFYGKSGDRPHLKTSGNTLVAYDALRHVHIIGLHLEAYKMNPDDRAFDGSTSANIRLIGNHNNILFEDLKLRFVEFIVQGGEGTIRNITIRRSMILDKYSSSTSYNKNSRPSGIYTDNGEGLTIEDNVWDHNGWNAQVSGAGANMYNHNMYISERNNVGNKVVVRNNIVTRGSSHGVHGRPGGLYENNFFARNAISLQMGYHGGSELSSGTFAYARDNVITEGVHMNRGVNSCSDSKICTGAIWGIWVEKLGQADVRVERNIVSNRLPTSLSNYSEGIKHDSQAQYRDNIVYKWNDNSQGTDQRYPDPGRTLADYNAALGGKRSFEDFMEVVRNRPLQTWDERYTAGAINDYIRAGFGR